MIASSVSFQGRICSSESIFQNGYAQRRRSLVSDAKSDTERNKIAQEHLLKELKKDDLQHSDLTEEEIILLSQISDDCSTNKIVTNVVFSIQDDFTALPQILKCIENCNAHIEHLETRRSRKEKNVIDILVKLANQRNGLRNLIKTVRQSNEISITVVSNEKLYLKENWFPRHISDLDKCSHILSKLEPVLDSSHPGYNDVVYRARRIEIAQIGLEYKQGQCIPHIYYTDEETKTWNLVYKKMRTLIPKYACKSYIKAFKLLEENGIYRSDAIPQLQDVSMFLKKNSGFSLRPAAGLVSARDFLASLAFRVFQCTQYIRHSSSPHHTIEPDCIHELLGHIPMFSDPVFARFSQEIGLASLGASDEEIEKLATVYWFTVEFGLCKENGSTKAYGAALLSSYGELLHAVSDKPQFLAFDPLITAVQPYQDQEFQDIYFVANSFDDAKEKVRDYVNNHMHRQYHVIYDPYTEQVQVLDSLEKLETFSDSIKSDFSTFKIALSNFK